jgi:hypothetical protein
MLPRRILGSWCGVRMPVPPPVFVSRIHIPGVRAMTKDGTIIVFVDNMDDIVNFDFLEAYGGYLVYEVPRDDTKTWGKLMTHTEKTSTTVILMTRNIRFIWFLATNIERRRQSGGETSGNVFFVNITKIVHVNGLGDVTVQNEYEVRSLEKEEIPSIRQ